MALCEWGGGGRRSRGKEKVIQVEEREGAGQPKRKGTKEATTVAGGEKTEPANPADSVGVLKREGCHLSPCDCPLWGGG